MEAVEVIQLWLFNAESVLDLKIFKKGAAIEYCCPKNNYLFTNQFSWVIETRNGIDSWLRKFFEFMKQI